MFQAGIWHSSTRLGAVFVAIQNEAEDMMKTTFQFSFVVVVFLYRVVSFS